MPSNRRLLAIIAVLAVTNTLVCLLFLFRESSNAGRIGELTKLLDQARYTLQQVDAVRLPAAIQTLEAEKSARRDLQEDLAQARAQQEELRKELVTTRNNAGELRKKMAAAWEAKLQDHEKRIQTLEKHQGADKKKEEDQNDGP